MQATQFSLEQKKERRGNWAPEHVCFLKVAENVKRLTFKNGHGLTLTAANQF